MMITNEEERLRQSLTFTEATIPERISADPEVVENGLAKLVLSIVELIRRLLEKQALRRMEAAELGAELQQFEQAFAGGHERAEAQKDIERVEAAAKAGRKRRSPR